MLDTAKIDVFGNPTDFAQFAKNALQSENPYLFWQNKQAVF